MSPITADTEAGRAVTPVLAIVLLIGIVAAGSLSVLVVGTDVLVRAQSDAEVERIENGFVALGSEIGTATLSRDDVRSADLDLRHAEGAIRKEATGQIVVSISDGTEVANQTIGSIEYELDDTTIAYQAGGVWRGTGATSQMVSTPPIYYRDGTLTLPIPVVVGDDERYTDEVTIVKRSTTTPTIDVPAIDGKLATVTITSEYYGGWARFFETRTDAGAVSVDHDAQTVTVLLGQPTVDGDFEEAMVAQGTIVATHSRACVFGNVSASGSIDEGKCNGSGSREPGVDHGLQPLDEAINLTIDATTDADSANVGAGGVTLTAGTYRTDDLVLRDDLTIDLTDGNVTLVVDGHLALDNAEILVENGGVRDAVARVYTTGDVAIGGGNGGVAIDDGESRRFQVYGTSQLHFGLGQGSFEGTVYAPREEPADGRNEAATIYGISSAVNCKDVDGEPADVCIGQGNVDFVGSIVAGSMVIEQSSTVRHDPGLVGVSPELVVDGVVLPPPLTHLHVSVHEVDVSGR